jgi:hypothetical protein
MTNKAESQRRGSISLSPRFAAEADMQRTAELFWISVAARIAVLSEGGGLPTVGAVSPVRARALSEATERFGASDRPLRVALSTLCHLVLRGWRVTVDDDQVSIRRKGVRLQPQFATDPKVQRDTERIWASIGVELMKLSEDHRFPDTARVGVVRERALTDATEQLGAEQAPLCLLVSVLCRLVVRGWYVWVVNGQVYVERKRLRLRPRFAVDPEGQRDAEQFWVAIATQLSRLPDKDGLPNAAAIGALRTRSLSRANACFGRHAQSVRLAVSILCDLALQGWRTEVKDGQACICWPNPSGGRSDERQRARTALLIARDEQLGESAVRTFVQSMETRRRGPQGWHSIYSLMRNGAELAAALRQIDPETPEEAQLLQLRRIIRPYLQFVTEDARCEWTGLRLSDIWRYFRFTWLTPARSTPGRTMMVLVRDGALEPHPVIGIAALSSSIVQQRCRDEWIGWDRESVLRLATEHPTDELADWLLRSLQELIDGIRVADFFEGGRLHPADLLCPHEAVIEQLREFGLPVGPILEIGQEIPGDVMVPGQGEGCLGRDERPLRLARGPEEPGSDAMGIALKQYREVPGCGGELIRRGPQAVPQPGREQRVDPAGEVLLDPRKHPVVGNLRRSRGEILLHPVQRRRHRLGLVFPTAQAPIDLPGG